MLDPARFTLDEHANQNWTLTVESNTTIDDVMKPEFLANVSSRLRPYDRIRVRIDTGEWYAELLVITCGRVWAKVIQIFYVDLVDKGVDMLEGEACDQFLVQHRGPHLKFCVIRKKDKEPIKEKLDTKEEAQLWLTNYTRAL